MIILNGNSAQKYLKIIVIRSRSPSSSSCLGKGKPQPFHIFLDFYTLYPTPKPRQDLPNSPSKSPYTNSFAVKNCLGDPFSSLEP